VTEEHATNIDKAVLTFAGFAVLLGLALGYWVSRHWYLPPALAGFNMVQASFTGFCPAAIVFKKLGLRSGNRVQWPRLADPANVPLPPAPRFVRAY